MNTSPLADCASIDRQRRDVFERTHIPRPGMFPPTLNGSFETLKEAPRSPEMRICPLLGSQEFVYIPVASERLGR